MIHVTERGIRDEYHVSYDESLAVQPWQELAQIIETDDINGEKTVRTVGLRGMEKRRGMPNFAATVPTRPYHWVTEDWNDGFQVTQDEWEHDKASTVTTRTQDLATIAAAKPLQLVEEVASDLVDDLGVYAYKDPFNSSVGFISASHVTNLAGSRTGTTSNYFTSSEVAALECVATTPTVAEWIDILLGVAVQIQLMKGDNDQRMFAHITQFTVAVPPLYIINLQKALTQNSLATGESNPLLNGKFSFNSMMLPTATSTTGFLMCPGGRRPIGVQMLLRPDRKAMNILGPGTEHYQKEEYAAIWIRGRFAATHLFWENVVGCTINAA